MTNFDTSARIETFDEDLDEENEYDDDDTDSDGMFHLLVSRLLLIFFFSSFFSFWFFLFSLFYLFYFIIYHFLFFLFSIFLLFIDLFIDEENRVTDIYPDEDEDPEFEAENGSSSDECMYMREERSKRRREGGQVRSRGESKEGRRDWDSPYTWYWLSLDGGSSSSDDEFHREAGYDRSESDDDGDYY